MPCWLTLGAAGSASNAAGGTRNSTYRDCGIAGAVCEAGFPERSSLMRTFGRRPTAGSADSATMLFR